MPDGFTNPDGAYVLRGNPFAFFGNSSVGLKPMKPEIKTYPAVFETFQEAENFRLPPNTRLYAIRERFHMRSGAVRKTSYTILYTETHVDLENGGSV